MVEEKFLKRAEDRLRDSAKARKDSLERWVDGWVGGLMDASLA